MFCHEVNWLQWQFFPSSSPVHCCERHGCMRTGATATSMNSPVCSRLSALWWDLSQKQNPVMAEVWNVKQKTIFSLNSSRFWCQDFLAQAVTCGGVSLSNQLWQQNILEKQSRPFHTNIPQSTVRKNSFNKKVIFLVRTEKQTEKSQKSALQTWS